MPHTLPPLLVDIRGDDGRFTNHDWHPNLCFGTIQLGQDTRSTYASRDIKDGEELLDDYTTYGDNPVWYDEINTACGVDESYLIRPSQERSAKRAKEAVVDLAKCLQGMNPGFMIDAYTEEPGEYVFCLAPDGFSLHDISPEHLLGMFTEHSEGTTLYVTKRTAEEQKLTYEGSFRCITLSVNSSLEAVGLTAAVSNLLKEAGIPANVVAAYFHDHVFVPISQADKALELLQSLQRESLA